MIRRILRQDLAWAGFILMLAAAFGLGQQWRLVRLSWTGGLPAHLEDAAGAAPPDGIPGSADLEPGPGVRTIPAGAGPVHRCPEPRGIRRIAHSRRRQSPPGTWRSEEAGPWPACAADRQLVVYCGQVSCDAALKVAEKLQALGFSRVAVFLGGFQAWDEAGYPADTSK